MSRTLSSRSLERRPSRTVIAWYHRRGFAGSDRHAAPFGIEKQAEDALALLEELGVERAHLIGHSYGAVISLQLACETPSAVHSLVLLEPPKTTEELEGLDLLEPVIAMYRSGNTGEAAASFMALVWGRDWRAEVQRTVPGGPEQAETDAATYFEFELPALGAWILDKDKASQISQPILYIIGSESGPVFDRPKQAISVDRHTRWKNWCCPGSITSCLFAIHAWLPDRSLIS